MDMYVQVIVSYDISDTKNRTKFYEELKNIGLTSIMKSVFWGYLLPSEKRVVNNLMKKYCDTTDKCIIVNAQLHQKMSDTIGFNKNDFNRPDDFLIL